MIRAGGGPPRLAEVDFAQAPFVVIWETTQACDLACLHCRANARNRRDPEELTTEEARQMMKRIREGFGQPLFILTGGDPLKRPDIIELVRYGHEIGLRMALTPSGTPLMTPEIIGQLADAGLARLAVSLDGSSREIHDRFRGVNGSFEWTIRMLRAARERGVTTQVNTTVSKHNLADFDNLAQLMTELGIVLWSVFFVVPTGRARPSDIASAEEFEDVFNRMYDLSKRVQFDIKSTAAPHYRRVVLQRRMAEQRAGGEAIPEALTPGAAYGGGLTSGASFSMIDGIGRAKGVNDGRGFIFVSHRGELFPNGLFPLASGDVRNNDIVDVYRHAELFVGLRDPDQLKGKCRVCEFRSLCGGSRARAWALTGDPYEAEPYCAYVPPAYQAMVERGEAEPVEEYFAHRIASWSEGRAHGFERDASRRQVQRTFQLPPNK